MSALFKTGDTILFRPIETWTEGNKKQARVDYHGVTYHTMGLPVGPGKYSPFPARDSVFLHRTIERAATERTNVFFGVAPRFARGNEATNTSYDLAWQIRTVRCLWSDVDDCLPDDAVKRCAAVGLPDPSIIVASGHGSHVYWLLDSPVVVSEDPPPPVHAEFVDQGGEKKKRRRLYTIGEKNERCYLDVPTHREKLLDKAQEIQDTMAGIAAAIGGDHTTDLSRILRVPGTLNRKNERNGKTPVPCNLVVCEPDRRYPLSCFRRFLESSPQKLDRERIEKIPLPKPKGKSLGARGQSRLDSLIADCVSADQGTRSESDFALCCWAVEHGQPSGEVWNRVLNVGKFAEGKKGYFDRTWDAACSHTREQIYAKARGKADKKAATKVQQEHQEGKDGLDHAVIKDSEEGVFEATDDPHRLARLNLERYATRTDGRTLRYWRSEWYVWKRGRYQKITTDEFRAKLSFSIREEFKRIAAENSGGGGSGTRDNEDLPVQKVTASLVGNVMLATSGMPAVCVSSHVEMGTWLPEKRRRSWMAMANGIIDVDAIIAERDDYLYPHSPEWFSTVRLPYAFDIDGKCPRFDKFLEHNLELDPERIKILQEWAGYLLLPDTGEQRFMLLEGEGANGKSVFVAALTAMLGADNVSNVPLEKFGDRFSLSTTIGKLLNAAADCGEIDKSAEGDLKSFVSGDRMMFDRKGLPAVECAPTARLMIACNNHPRVSDRSQGVWRRMLLIPWLVQIDKEMRVRGMDKVEWWQDSGELPGILNWAIVGLSRLRSQRDFTESAVMQEAIQDYREEMNPAKVFLQEHCEAHADTSIRSSVLYRFYRKWTEDNGYHPLSNRVFGREVKRAFPQCSRKQRNDGGSKIWVIHGMKFSQDEICGEKTEEYRLF